VALLNIVFFGFGVKADAWVAPIWIIAVSSMVLGNLAALRQTNIVRMLAYSSVAQGGFMLVPVRRVWHRTPAITTSLSRTRRSRR